MNLKAFEVYEIAKPIPPWKLTNQLKSNKIG